MFSKFKQSRLPTLLETLQKEIKGLNMKTICNQQGNPPVKGQTQN